jgi:PIN domain nuclease of toxin-antitoxin system
VNALIDTHALLWIAGDEDKVSVRARNVFLNPRNDLYFSTANLWEMAIKISIKKLNLGSTLNDFIDDHIIGNGIRLLPIKPSHVVRIATMPFIHRDPFDRLMIAQALAENMRILSSDRQLDGYSVQRIW